METAFHTMPVVNGGGKEKSGNYLLRVIPKAVRQFRIMARDTSPLTNWIVGIASTVLAAGIGWIGLEMVNTRDAIRDVNVKIPSIQEDVTDIASSVKENKVSVEKAIEDSKSEVKETLKTLVTRPEFEVRLSEVKTENAKIQAKQSDLSFEIFKLQEAARARDESTRTNRRP